MQINIDLMQITIDSQPPSPVRLSTVKKKNTTSFASAVITAVYNGFPESLVDATNSQKSMPYHFFNLFFIFLFESLCLCQKFSEASALLYFYCIKPT